VRAPVRVLTMTPERHRITMQSDDSVPRGKPEISGDGANLDSIKVRFHRDDEALAMALVKKALREMGATNLKLERPQ
jgi:hypothetical protein